jgi:pyruvate/2-oxoglutarate dehydrogenase complex dihydrolipoamide acyltransferase (E2) component
VLSTFKLEEKKLSLINCDIKSLATIMSTSYPMNFHASNVKIIDYQNVNIGFIFDTGCDYEGATTTGEILFEKISFKLSLLYWKN